MNEKEKVSDEEKALIEKLTKDFDKSFEQLLAVAYRKRLTAKAGAK